MKQKSKNFISTNLIYYNEIYNGFENNYLIYDEKKHLASELGNNY